MRHRLYKFEPKYVRDKLRDAHELAMQIHKLENELVEKLCEIDQQRLFVRLRIKSLRTFCILWLRFTFTQSQRIVTQVRRKRTTRDIGQTGV